MDSVPFNIPPVMGDELDAIGDAIARRRLAGDGHYTKLCETWLRERLGSREVFLTHSCTAALEMAALLLDLGPGDEVIMPSFTFSSTANAVVLRGAVPVFADIDPATMNIDIGSIERLVTPRTKAISVVHYAGRPPDMDRINSIAARHGLGVMEDAAQSLGSTYKGRPAGTHSAVSAISFHETKNIVSGEGGALIINDPNLVERAAILREKGTNRRAFLEGQVDKYTWVDVGSSYLPSEILAAYLLSQLKATDEITADRVRSWRAYRDRLAPARERFGIVLPPETDTNAEPNGHIFHFLLPRADQRPGFLADLKARGIQSSFHYVPLHSSPAGRRFGKAPDGCPVTEDAAARLVRLPLYYGMGEAAVAAVAAAVIETLARVSK